MTIGVDIGGTKTHAVALGAGGEVLGEVRRRSGHGEELVVLAAVQAVETLAGELPGRAIARVGIGIPGTVDHLTGEVQQALNLGLDHVALGAQVSRRLGVPVHVENDVNAAALGSLGSPGEAEGRGAEPPSLAYLNLGTGLAVGTVLDGRLWRGVTGAAGEIGHIPLDPDGPLCVCGQRGCIEAMASGSGIARQWGADVPSAPEIADLAASGDERAASVLERLVWAVAGAVRLIVLAQDVRRVVIGGGLALALGERLRLPVLAQLREWEAASPFLASVAPADRVVLAPADRPLAAIGAALAARPV
ncbi:MAG: ROK family protein [Microbacteriaceae bacterium]|nr:ROK family protein [Microbacteriaceae bacterium]